VSLPRKTKLGYGAAEPGVLAVETLARLHVLKFYTDVLGLRPELAGAAAAIAIVWDAFADLFIGLASDRTRSRFGRRRPFLLAGGLALAGSCVLLFHPPAATSELVKTAFLLGSFIALNTSVSLLSVPHTALASELTFDRDERTELFGYRLFLGNLGLLAGSTLPGLALAYAERGQITREAAYGLASWGVGGLVLVTAITSFAATSGRDRSPPDVGAIGPRVLLHSFRDVLGDRTFRPLLIAYLIAQIGLAINGTFALYYYEYRLRLSADDVARVLGVFVTAWSLSIPAWVMASRRWGKRWLAFSGITLLGVLTAWIYLVAPPGQLVLPMVIAVLGGALAGSIVVLEAIVADVVDVDELRHRRKREGLYFGVWKMTAKMSRGVAVAGSGALLGLIGFVPNTAQSPEVAERLAWVFGPGVGGFLILGALVFLCMPLTDAAHRRVQRVLVRRCERAAARIARSQISRARTPPLAGS
jgi:Na+/melibiose symporter-like transporter